MNGAVANLPEAELAETLSGESFSCEAPCDLTAVPLLKDVRTEDEMERWRGRRRERNREREVNAEKERNNVAIERGAIPFWKNTERKTATTQFVAGETLLQPAQLQTLASERKSKISAFLPSTFLNRHRRSTKSAFGRRG